MPLVVIVDDRSTNLKILRRFAERLGPDITALTFEGADLALDGIADEMPDLIVTDFVMPKARASQFVGKGGSSCVTFIGPKP